MNTVTFSHKGSVEVVHPLTSLSSLLPPSPTNSEPFSFLSILCLNPSTPSTQNLFASAQVVTPSPHHVVDPLSLSTDHSLAHQFRQKPRLQF
jgi:hypothetical protein